MSDTCEKHPCPACAEAARLLPDARPLTPTSPLGHRLERALERALEIARRHDTPRQEGDPIGPTPGQPNQPEQPGQDSAPVPGARAQKPKSELPMAALSISPAELTARFKRIDAYFTPAAAEPFLEPETTLRGAALALREADVVDDALHRAVVEATADFTARVLRLAETIHLLHGPDPAPPLSALPGLWKRGCPTLAEKLSAFEAEAARLARPSGRVAERFPGNPARIPEAILPAYVECVRTVNVLLHHRPFLASNLEQEAHGTVLDRFETLLREARFEARPVEEPALRFRPHILPFPCEPLIAAEYYRTEQEIKETAMRLASYGCLAPEHAVRLSAEAERFTESLALYADQCAEKFWEGDHQRLFVELVRIVNRYPLHCQRMLFVRLAWRVMHPAGQAGNGVSDLLRTLADAQRAHQSVVALRSLAGL
jgi:hypothetical protein